MSARPSKYGNRKTVVDGVTYASAKEARRYGELQLLQRAGAIADLRRQVRFPLKVNDRLVTTYVADAVYREGDALVVEDTKGFRTREYVLKAKLFAAVHGFPIREV